MFKTDGANSDRKLTFIEFCAGSASLSAAMMRAGFHDMPVDFAGNKFSPKVKAIDIDLASTVGRQLASELVDNVHPFAVHFGLPCGTCSIGHVNCPWPKNSEIRGHRNPFH